MINVIYNRTDYEILERQKEAFDKYCKIIQWGRENPTRFMEQFLELELTDHQKYCVLGTWATSTAVWLMSRNSGKALAKDIEVYTQISDRGINKYSKKKVKDLKVGDKVYTPKGNLTEIIHMNSFVCDDTYEVEFEDGEIIECNAEHLWKVYDAQADKHNKYGTKWRIANTDFIKDNLFREKNSKKVKNGYNSYRFYVPLTKPIQYPNYSNLIIPPYLLGLWLGDGTSSCGDITCGKEDIDDTLNNLRTSCQEWQFEFDKIGDNYKIYPNRLKDFTKKYKLKKGTIEYEDYLLKTFRKKLESLNLLNNKHIPDCYMYASINDRYELLAGLLDSDGTASLKKDGSCEFVQAKESLARQVKQLMDSLGIPNTLSKKEKVKYVKKNGKFAEVWRIYFRADKTMPIFKLKRKFNRLPDELNDIHFKKAIVDVRKTSKKQFMRCITLSDPDGLFLCGNNYTVTHNSYLASPYMMTRSILIPNMNCYIMGPAGNQAKELFGKLESLAKGNIASVIGASNLFVGELMKASGSDGFVHDKNSNYCSLYNGSSINTLNSVIKNIVGIRSNLSVFEEAGKIDREFYALAKPFSAQDTNFITGNINQDCYPRQLPNQMLYISSAESIDTELYDMYKLCARNMLLGNKEYFVVDLDSSFSLAPRINGKPSRPLVKKSVIEDAYRTNKFKAAREYGNIFDRTGGQDALVNRGTLEKFSVAYEPIKKNEDNKKYIIVYDPSTKRDNSMVVIFEIFEDPEKGYMLKVVNCKNLVETLKNGEKLVIQKPKQIEMIKDFILDYNGKAEDYKNLEHLIIDAGAGGGGFDIAQFLMNEWTGKDKKLHRGFIDLEDPYMSPRSDDYPNNAENLTMFNFKKNKVLAYEAAQDMINQGLVIFPKNMNARGEIEFTETQLDGSISVKCVKASQEDFLILTEVELMKEELIGMEKTKNSQSGAISFDTSHEMKMKGLHDDRSDCVAMACWYLAKIRAEARLHVDKTESDFKKFFNRSNSNLNKRASMFVDENPFKNLGSNPFLEN